MNRRCLMFVLCVLLLSLAWSETVNASGFGEIESVCLVVEGQVDLGGFNQMAYDGMLRAVEEFELESDYIEVQAGGDYADAIDTCVEDGYDAVVAVGWAMSEALLAAAEANPDVLFIGIDQYVDNGSANLVGVQYREDQAGFLVGAMAALMTESDTIAGVYGYAIPPVVKFRNGYEQGARFVNPDIEVFGEYIDSFIDMDRGAAAAEDFMDDDADVIFGAGGFTGAGAILYAAEHDVWVIGVDVDEYFTTFEEGDVAGSDHLITSALKRIDNGVYQLLEIAAGDDESLWIGGSNYILSAENDGIGCAPVHDAAVPDEVTERITEILEGLRDGDIETGVDPVTGELLEPTD